eukprot:TRINITY_DN31431_c0_g1_i1.p1 TRINITY_DN31431_c0_g1~~TRINITY_DN31431_c0_g1_i1.p1  ORF type:complete len:593 (+),score=118.15 TRINITY_DN31431_c0_g1_i1:264-1781(+)
MGVSKSALIEGYRDTNSIESHYKILETLGAGAFGAVSLVEDPVLKEKRVYKVVNTQGCSRFIIDLMKREIELLRKLDHPSIIRLMEYAEDTLNNQITLVLEFIPDGDCECLLKGKQALDEGFVARIALQLYAALHYCHIRKVIHRDVKPANIMLVKPHGAEEQEPDIKLIDFGLAEGGKASMQDYVGSPLYMPPELHRREQYTASADIWSAGMTTLELLVGHVPFPEPYEKSIGGYTSWSQLEAHLQKKPGHWNSRSEESEEFIKFVLVADPKARPQAKEATEHEWIDDHRPDMRKFPTRIARALARHNNLHPLMRLCLFNIAARTGAGSDPELGHAFLGADSDTDGLISISDLEQALEDMDSCTWWWDSARRADAAQVLAAADLDHRGGLTFTEFVAAAITDKYHDIHDLATTAFNALDHDRDGLLKAADLHKLFRQRDRPFLEQLPQDRGFDVHAWCHAVKEFMKSDAESSDSDDSGPDISMGSPRLIEKVNPRVCNPCFQPW